MSGGRWKRLRVGNLPLTKTGRIARKIEKLIKRNGWFKSHTITVNGKTTEYMDYYPQLYYKKQKKDNIFCIRIRLDGTLYSNKFRTCEQLLADMFETTCVDKIEERGYITYSFELRPQKQTIIASCKDISDVGENKIAFSDDIIWDWKKCLHLLLTGNTGSGKTQLAQYIIACLVRQNVRVIYCDPKNDDDMRLFMRSYPSVKYLTKENDIAKAVRELEEELRMREGDLNNMGLDEAEFNPVFLLFDELIAFSKIADKKTYDETARRLSSVIVMGRSKRIYAGLILQRPDTSFIEGAIRDNLGCRIAMGQMSDTAYKMVFGSDFSDVKNRRREIGSGLIFRNGEDIQAFPSLYGSLMKGICRPLTGMRAGRDFTGRKRWNLNLTERPLRAWLIL